MKKNWIMPALLLLLITASCNTQDKRSELVGKWQAVTLDNPQLTEVMNMQKQFLDTFGTHTTAQQNMQIYGFTNIDSGRQALLKEMDDYMAMQDHAVKNTWFEFKKDGKVIMNFSGQVDTSDWTINDAGKLVLDEGKQDTANSIRLDILSLSDTMLKLQMTDRGMNSTVIFKPADK